jgi:hypothetical protein
VLDFGVIGYAKVMQVNKGRLDGKTPGNLSVAGRIFRISLRISN